MERYVDLHLHTKYSDGTLSETEILEVVRSKNLTAFSITDHDTLKGFRAVQRVMQPNDPELVAGLELSVTVEAGDVHLLAYLFDPDDERLNAALEEFQERRNQRARLIVQKLNDMNISISYEAVLSSAGEAAVGRPHIADTLVRAHAVSSYDEAFEKYLRNDGPAYVPKENFTPEEAISAVHQAQGIVVLAHPVLDNAIRHIELLVDLGLDGIEIYHPVHKQRDTERLRRIAEKFGLIVSGGSDFHGRSSWNGAVGSQFVPESCLAEIKQRAEQRRRG